MGILITETTEDVRIIEEAANDDSGKKNYYIEGIIMQGDIKNRNGRIYPKEILFNEVNRYRKENVDKKKAYGELNHPDSPTINLDRVSHMFVSLEEDGSNIIGKAKIMDTPMGKIVKSLIDEGANLGISSRGVGSVKQNAQGIMEIQKNFMISTAGDIVADPSAPNAFVRGIMEGSEWIFDIASNQWVEAAKQIVEETVRQKNTISEEEKEAKIFELFQNFLMKSA